jgi:hypothetical protein
VAHDAKHGVRDAVALDRVACAGFGMHGAVGPAQPTAAEDLARVLGRDRLVQFSGRAVEVENELVRRGQAAVPVSPVSASTALAPVNCCQRSMATST